MQYIHLHDISVKVDPGFTGDQPAFPVRRTVPQIHSTCATTTDGATNFGGWHWIIEATGE